jgi:prepilin-type processing-associated H-X9-DG protein
MTWREPSQGIHRVPERLSSPFRYGANLLFVDGSVRFLTNSVSPPTMKALATPNGGETVSRDAY